MKLDTLDFLILEQLKTNSKQPLNILQEKLGKKTSTIHSRIKKLEQKKIIKNYTINVDYKTIGYPLTAYVMINFDNGATDLPQDIIAGKIADRGQVEEVHLIAGEFDILVKVRAKDLEDLGIFITRDLKDIEGIGNSRTFVSLNKLKDANQTPYLFDK